MGRASLTYSTEFGSICQECERPKDECTCNPSANPKDGINTVRVSSTNKGRKGKTVTLIKGLRMNPSELKAYAGKLKPGLFKERSLRFAHGIIKASPDTICSDVKPTTRRQLIIIIII